MGQNYPSFQPSYSHEDLVEHFLLTPGELDLALKCRGDANRCGMALLLKTLPHLGYVPDIPPEVRDFIAGQIGLLWDCSESYPWHSSTFDLHLAQVRESTGWRFASGADKYADKATPVFLGQRGRLTPRGFQLLLERYTKAANLKDVTPHSRRHSFCKNLANAGVSLEKIAVLAGHESLETTRRYCEPSLGELQEAVELVSEEE